MIKVHVTKQSNYPVKTPVIKKKLARFFEGHGIVSDAEVSVAIVGEKRMMEVGKKFLKDGELHNVLSFVEGGEKFVYGKAASFAYPPGSPINLGEIIVCYPLAVKESVEENILIDEKVYELIEHGGLHLMGIHHKE